MRFTAPYAWLPEGWRREVLLEVAPDGFFRRVSSGAREDDALRLAGPVLPGFANVHSHAFQRALVGRVQIAGEGADSFWTWREQMYEVVGKLGSEELEAIAAQTYVEQLKGGYTTVCEFHYLHGATEGAKAAPPERNSLAIYDAARQAGIALTLLPVLYQTSGFGAKPLLPRQRRFGSEVDDLLRLVQTLRQAGQGDRLMRLGVAPHSLRAVPPEALAALIEGIAGIDAMAPIHIHIAEQRAEVEDCVAALGCRPVAWLLDHAPVDERWCLVHATHLLGEEVAALASSGAVAGLCPSTEGDLGDGFFPLRPYLSAGGRLGIGSDSNLCASVFEELRWLEYGQRLRHESRNQAALQPGASTGTALVQAALAGGAQASGQAIGALASGKRADFLVLDAEHPALLGLSPDRWLDALVFSNTSAPPIAEVYVAGEMVVQAGRHLEEERLARRFAAALRRL